MAKRPNDDLFAGTTMTFGEHLEELRICLFKAMIGLVLGVIIGMLVADQVVQWIQVPLRTAIEKYYVVSAVEKLTVDYQDKLPEHFLQFIIRNRVTFDEVFFEREQLERLVRFSEQASKANSPKSRTTEDEAGQQEGTVAEATKDQTPVEEFLAVEAATAELEHAAHDPLGAPAEPLIRTRIWKPMRIGITSLSAQEVFMIWMKAAFVAGTVIASPIIFYQIWNFVAAGLYPHEKNYVYIYMPFSILLFVSGAGMAFFFVFEPVLDFLFTFNRAMNINPEPRISEWISFVLLLPIGFGVSFQLPLVMLFINRIGIVSVQVYAEKWRIAILLIFVISAVLTPADPVSLLFMAGPLTLLYFLGIGLCKWMPSSRNPYAEAEEL